jgi:hypothetical protein
MLLTVNQKWHWCNAAIAHAASKTEFLGAVLLTFVDAMGLVMSGQKTRFQSDLTTAARGRLNDG